MNETYDIVICIFQVISTIAIFKLLAYTIVRYRTSKKGGIYTGFTTAGFVLVILGMCVYCLILSSERLMLVLCDEVHTSRKYIPVLKTLENMSYLFSICWINAICVFVTKQTSSMNVPKKNHLIKDFGFHYPNLQKWLPYTIIIPTLYGSIVVVLYVTIDYNEEIKRSESDSGLIKPNLYSLLTFNIISGICIIMNTISLIVLGRHLRKSSVPMDGNEVSVWKKIPRSLKSAIKCCVIMTIAWTIELISWLVVVCTNNLKNNNLTSSTPILKFLQIIHSLQGLVLFLVVFFYRSKRDQNPVIRAVSNSLARSTQGNEGLNAAENRLNT